MAVECEGYLRLFRPTEGGPFFSHYGIRSESVWEEPDFMPAGNRIFQSDLEVGKHRQELGSWSFFFRWHFPQWFSASPGSTSTEFCTVWDFLSGS